MANQYEVQPEWRMFLPEEPEGESSRQRSVAQKVVDTVMALDLKSWAKSRAKLELQANSKVKALRDEILGDLRQKYAQEDQGRTEPLTPVETALRAREWAQAREQFNPHPRKEPVGINQHFSMPTRNPHPEMEGEYYKRGKENIINKALGKPLFADVKDGIHLYDDREGVIAAMQLAQQRYGGSFGVQGGGERFRSIVAANAIMLDIPLKGEEMQRRVDGLRAMIDKEKDKLLIVDKWKQYVPEPEPERQVEPVVERAPERTPVKVVEMSEPEVYDAHRYGNRGKETADEVFPAVKVAFVVENEGGQVKLDYDSGKNPGREFSIDGKLDDESARVAAELARMAGINLDEHNDRSKIAEVQKMYDQMRGRAPEVQLDDIIKGLEITNATIIREFTGNPNGREEDGWKQDPQAIVEFTLRDQDDREIRLLHDTMHNDFQISGETPDELTRAIQAAFEATNDEAIVFNDAADMVGHQLSLGDQAQKLLDNAIHERHLLDIASQLQGGTPSPDPQVPGHVGRNAQGGNVCAINDEKGNIKAWGVYGDDGIPHVSHGDGGWKTALDQMVREAMRARESASSAKETPEKETPEQDRESDDRDM